MIFSTRIDLAPEVDAPLVFVGYGLTIPEKNYDDLAGLDLKGKVAVILTWLTGGNPGRARPRTIRLPRERWKASQKAGVIGSYRASPTPPPWMCRGRASP